MYHFFTVFTVLLVAGAKALPELCVPPPVWSFHDIVSHLSYNISQSSNSATAGNGNLSKNVSSFMRTPFEGLDSQVTLVALNSLRENRAQENFFVDNLESIHNHMVNVRGFQKIRFILINSKDSFNPPLIEQTRKRVSFEVYQELPSAPADTLLNAANGDIFIFDRCGLLAYYIPFPLSFIHTKDPFLQATILAAYTDSPCKLACKNSTSGPSGNQTTTTTTTVLEATTEHTLILNQTANSFEANDTNVANVTGNSVQANTTEQTNSSDELYDHMGEILQNFYDLFRKKIEENVNQTTGSEAPVGSDSVNQTLESQGENTTVASTVLSQLGVSALQLHPLASDCNQTICREWSTERLLKARLCCLNYPNDEEKELLHELSAANSTIDSLDFLSQTEGGFGCQLFVRARCYRILNVLKCCTRKLVDDYFDYTIRQREQQQKKEMINDLSSKAELNAEVIPSYTSMEYMHHSISSRLFERQIPRKLHRKRVHSKRKAEATS